MARYTVAQVGCGGRGRIHLQGWMENPHRFDLIGVCELDEAKMKKVTGGKLKRFSEGALHALTLSPHIRKIFKGAMVDEFFATDRKSTRYWCLRVDPAKSK